LENSIEIMGYEPDIFNLQTLCKSLGIKYNTHSSHDLKGFKVIHFNIAEHDTHLFLLSVPNGKLVRFDEYMGDIGDNACVYWYHG